MSKTNSIDIGNPVAANPDSKSDQTHGDERDQNNGNPDWDFSTWLSVDCS